MKNSQPNIFFIILDTFRADRLLLTSNRTILTPFMKNIIENSLYFKNCIANSPWTVPSHISMFSGLYPTQNKLISKNHNYFSDKLPILAEILSDYGYKTICFTENAYISKNYGLIRGFDYYFQNYSNYLDKKLNCSIINFLTKILSLIQTTKNRNRKLVLFVNIFEKIIFYIRSILNSLLWVRIISHIIALNNETTNDIENTLSRINNFRENNKPLFIYLNIMTTHDPYIPLYRHLKTFNIKLKDFKKLKKFFLSAAMLKYKINLFSKKIPKKNTVILEKLYNSCILSSDTIVKKIFSILNNFNLLNNGFVIISSDHGEFLGNKLDHYLWEHNTLQSVDDSVLKVPLIIYNSNYKKKIIESQVQLKDIFHTILDLTGMKKNENQYFIPEKSLLFQISNNTIPKYIFGEYPKSKEVMNKLFNKYRNQFDRNKIIKIFNDIFFIRTNNYKYINYGNKIEEFYDLISDPFEKNNNFRKNNVECNSLKSFMKNKLHTINNLNNIENLLTLKEKDAIEKSLRSIKDLNI